MTIRRRFGTCRWCKLHIKWYAARDMWGRDSGDPVSRFRCLDRSQHPDSHLGHEPGVLEEQVA